MTLDQNSPVTIAVILSVTLIRVIALTRNTDREINIKLGVDKAKLV